MSYQGEDTLRLTGETSTIIGFHHFARILENRIAGIEVEFEVQAIKSGIQEKGRLNKIIRPYLEKMRAIAQLIRDMSNRISKMSDRDRLDYALKLKNQYVGLTAATINKFKVELKDVKNPELYDELRAMLLNITTIEMLTDEGSEVEGMINVSMSNKVSKVEELMNATTINSIGGELAVVELQNQFIYKYVMRRVEEDIFKVMYAINGDLDKFPDKFKELIEIYYIDNLEIAQDVLSTKFENNKAYDYFVGTVVADRLYKFYEKQLDNWKSEALDFVQENQM